MSHEQRPPYDVQQSLTRVFQSICITSPASFAFPSTPPSERTAPVQLKTEERQYLSRALRDLLYSRCFARSLNDATYLDTETLDFARRLSAANRGRDEWLQGWRVQEVKPGGVIVVTQGERLRFAKAGDYAMTLAEDVPLCIGCDVTLRVRKESLAVQEGTYCALGEESPSFEEESDVLRIYFNATQEAAIALVESTTQHFNRWCVPFTLKIMLRPQDRDRSDAAVLYLPKNYYHEFVRLLAEFPASFFSLLRTEVPLFTKRLRDGIGLAESPVGDESFGMHRCRLVAEGMVDAWLDGQQDVNARIHATEQSFASEGFSLARPYLNPGSEDIYSTRIEDVPQRQDVRRAVAPQIILTSKNIVAFMQERGLCDQAYAWEVLEYPSRNRNFGINRTDGGQGFFVKQLRVQDAESFRMMKREATVYQLAQQDPDFQPLKKLSPAFFGFDEDSKVLIIEFINAESFMQAHLRLQQFPVEFAQNLGAALAVLHRGVSNTRVHEIFSLRAPGIFDAHRNGPLMRWLSRGQKLLIARVREHAQLARELDALAASWRHDTFIHGDIKFENCMELASVPGRSPVVFVDWELADFAEPSWDLGSVFQSYLSLSVQAVPGTRSDSLEDLLKDSTMPVDTLKSAIQHFWQSYCKESFLDDSSRRALFERSLQCAAARMIQTALELMQGQAQPTRLALTHFDASVELMTRPRHVAQFLHLNEM